MKKIIQFLFLFPLALSVTAQVVSENLFYMVDTPESFASFKTNLSQISIVCPQTFQISKEGVISGSVDHRILELARANKIKVMPLIVNSGFTAQLLHTILSNPLARKRSIKMMLEYGKKYKLDGWQFDLEGLNISDRDNYTSYFKETADALHKAGLQLSAALVHAVENVGGPTPYHSFLYENWRAGYDFKELAAAGDFLSIMAYDQHTRRTPPGPVAGADWVERIVQYLINEGVAPEKISLGVPDYSMHWFPDYTEEKGGFSNGQQIGYKVVEHLLAKYNAELMWNEKAGCHYTFWDNDGVYEYMYIEDGASLKPKLDIVATYKLRGISVWVLGKEAPDFWTTLQQQTTVKK
ncbi:MAG TPA: glycosyl hydrolase family 18 protein [Chitinophagaceae bacterium]|nr:glycosyl hydrolase family 18 protein [Chitinophagaceae bacterium]